MPLSPFIWHDGQAMTPEQVARQRDLVEAARERAGDTSPVGHWTAGMARIVDALGGNLRERRADAAEDAGLASAKESFDPVLSAILGGGQPSQPMTAMTPSAAAGPVDGGAISAGLIERGLPPHIADGFVMNFQDESGLNPAINEIDPLVPGSRGGFGLAQWTGPRRKALEQFAAARGADVSDMNTQLDFLMHELSGPEADAARAIFAAPDAGSAAAAVVNDFLRPAEEHRARRVASYTGGQGYRPQGMDSGIMQALMGAQSDPWVAKQYGPVIDALMGQQFQRQHTADEYAMRTGDPAYQMGLEKAQLELEAMRNPAAPKPIEVGGVLLDPITYEPIFDSRQVEGGGGFTLSPGQQRFDDQGRPIASVGAEAPTRPITAEERAQWGIPADDQRPYSMTPDGPKPIGGSGVTVNNNMGGDKFGEEFAKGDAQTLSSVSDAGLSATRNLNRIDHLSNLLAESPSGFAARAQQVAGEWGINTEGLDNIQAAQALINSLVPEQRPPGSGPMSDADLELFKQSLTRIINAPGGNRIILETLRGIAEYDAEGARIVQRLRNGELSRAEAFDELQNRQNPLAGFKAPSASASPDTAGKARRRYNPASGVFE